MATLGMMYPARGVWFGVRWDGCYLKSGGLYNILFDVENYFRTFFDKENVYNVKTAGRISMQFTWQSQLILVDGKMWA